MVGAGGSQAASDAVLEVLGLGCSIRRWRRDERLVDSPEPLLEVMILSRLPPLPPEPLRLTVTMTVLSLLEPHSFARSDLKSEMADDLLEPDLTPESAEDSLRFRGVGSPRLQGRLRARSASVSRLTS